MARMRKRFAPHLEMGLRLPPGYALGYGDDVWELVSPKGAVVARFSVWGATKEGVEGAAAGDYQKSGKSAS